MVGDVRNPLTTVLDLTGSQRQLESAITAALGGPSYDPSRFPVASPWSSSDLARIIASDWAGVDAPANTRGEAMKIPGIARARNLIVSTLASAPLEVHDPVDQVVANAAPWFYSAGGGTSWQLRQAWTVDDLIFAGWSCWWREWSGDQISEVGRIPIDDWELTDDNQLLVDGVPVRDPRDVILFPGLHEGVLAYGKEALNDTRTLYRNVRARLFAPSPQLDLHQTEGDDLPDEEIDKLIARWAKARQGQLGGVSFTSKHIEVNELGGGADAQLLIEARNAAMVDCARIVGVHAGMIDATTPKSSLNYETSQGRNGEFVDFDLALYMTPITARLSLDDCLAPGLSAHINLSAFTSLAQPPTGPTLKD